MEVVKRRRNSSKKSRVSAIRSFKKRVVKTERDRESFQRLYPKFIQANLLSQSLVNFYELKTFHKKYHDFVT